MYSGALLATAARLAWDPSTYTWFRFLAVVQYRVTTAYVLAAGLWLAALVYLAAAAAHRTARTSLNLVSTTTSPPPHHHCTVTTLHAGGRPVARRASVPN